MKKVLLLIMLILTFSFLQSQNHKVKAILTYNFTKFLTWQQNDSIDIFKIGVLGNNDYLNNIKIISKNYKVGNKDIEILEFTNIEDLKLCNILYVIQENNIQIPEVIEKIRGFNTLLVTSEAQDISENLGINFIIENNKQKFEVYKDNIENINIEINNKLLKLGIEK